MHLMSQISYFIFPVFKFRITSSFKFYMLFFPSSQTFEFLSSFKTLVPPYSLKLVFSYLPAPSLDFSRFFFNGIYIGLSSFPFPFPFPRSSNRTYYLRTYLSLFLHCIFPLSTLLLTTLDLGSVLECCKLPFPLDRMDTLSPS